MSDTARQPAQRPELPVDERKQRSQEHPTQERQPSVPTSAQFYEAFVARDDVRAILKRLAQN